MATSGTEQGNRLTEVIAAEGRELEADFSRIEAETGPEERRRLTDQLLARLAHADQHEVRLRRHDTRFDLGVLLGLVEAVLNAHYPVLRKAFGDHGGGSLGDAGRAAEQE